MERCAEWQGTCLESKRPARGLQVRPIIRSGARSNDRATPRILSICMTYVYLLHLSNQDIYKGITDDLKRRLPEHINGKVESTRNYRPVALIGYEAYLLRSDAERRERFLKTTEGRRLLRQQYRDVLGKFGKIK